MKTVFVSYSHGDGEFAQKLVSWLEKQGHTVWMDKKKILPGANYVSSIAEGIRNADVFLPLLSPASVKSRWVAKEIMYALESDKDIIPVLVQFAEIPEHLKFAITGIHHVDFENVNEIDPWAVLDKALHSHGNDEGCSLDFEDSKSGREGLQVFFKRQQRKFVPVSIGLLLGLVVFLLLYLGLQRGNKKQTAQHIKAQNVVVVSSGSEDVAQVLNYAFSQKLEGTAPSAALGVLVQKRGGAAPWGALNSGDTLTSHDNYKIVFRPDHSCYVYVFQIDSSGHLDWLFPKNSTSTYSSGMNPIQAGKWHEMPGEGLAFHLDEMLGVEHIYIVMTENRWLEMEHRLQNGAAANPVRISEPLDLKTRGVGGSRVVKSYPQDMFSDSAGNIKSIIEGTDGVLVMEKWFYHERAKLK